MKRIARILAIFLTMAALILPSLVTPAIAVTYVPVTITIPATVAPDSDFTATINISDVTELNTAQYDILFNPAVLRLDSIDSGLIGSELFVADYNEISAGHWRVVQYAIPMTSTVSGSGFMAVLNFHVIGAPGSSSNIDITDGILSGIAGQIPATWPGPGVTINILGFSVSTHAATLIFTGSATVHGSLDDLGAYSEADVFFKWGTNFGNPDHTTATQTLTETGGFSTLVDTLSPNTDYFFQAAATANGETVYGQELSFHTPIIDVLRIFPAFIGRGATFDVTISFAAPADNFKSLGIHDEAPDNWPVQVNAAWCNPAPLTSKIVSSCIAEYTWMGPYTKGTTFTAVYKVTVPDDAALGTFEFPDGLLTYYIGTIKYTANINVDYQIQVVQGSLISGTTYETYGMVLPGVTVELYKDGDFVSSTISNQQGRYEIWATETGIYYLIPLKAGFLPLDQPPPTINITSIGEQYEFDFVGDNSLIPESPADGMDYFLRCMNLYLEDWGAISISMDKFLAVMNAYLERW